MKKIEFYPGMSLDEAIKMLKKESLLNKCVCYGEFNGKTINSTDSIDDIYISVIGTSRAKHIEYLENEQKSAVQREKEHFEKIPNLTLEYIEKAKGVIPDNKLDLWNRIVPIRLKDLYHGMELDCWIELVSILNKDSAIEDKFNDALQAFINQGHSGMSAGLVFSGLKEFHPLGERLVEYIKSSR